MNNLTEQRKNDNVAALRAAYDGKPWQYYYKGKWVDAEYSNVAGKIARGHPCRPTPEPEPPRPWDCADDVPGPVCWIRYHKQTTHGAFVLAIDPSGVWTFDTDMKERLLSWKDSIRHEYSTDRKEWKPCHKQP